MKALLTALIVAAFTATAYADVAPIIPTKSSGSPVVYVVITIAVIALIFWLVKRRKK